MNPVCRLPAWLLDEFSSLCIVPAVSRCCSQLPACCSWWMFDRFAATSCRRNFIPPTAWASERSLTFMPAQDCSSRPTLTPVSSLLSWVIAGLEKASPLRNPPICIFMLRYSFLSKFACFKQSSTSQTSWWVRSSWPSPCSRCAVWSPVTNWPFSLKRR